MKRILQLSILLLFFQSNYAQEKTTSRVAFLNYSIKEHNNGTYEIKLINKKIVEGTFKKKAYKKYASKQKYISCTQLDGKSNTLEVFEIKNPLNTHVEYVDEKENLAVKEVHLKETVFFVKIPLEKDATEIILTLVDPANKKSVQLITTKI
jgi:hypothetical protein